MADGSGKGKPDGYVFGRPTDYDASLCEKVIAWGKLGKSRAWIADELNIVRNTLKNWEATHPDFLIAMERAKQAEQRWWEDAGQGGMFADKFSAPVWSRSMAARFPEDWRESKQVEHKGGVTVIMGDHDSAI